MADSRATNRDSAETADLQDLLAVGGEPAVRDRETAGELPWEGDHPINIRLSIPFFAGRCYLTLVGGIERRGPRRRSVDRRKHPLVKRGNLLVLAVFGLLVGLVLLAVFQMATGLMLQQSGVLVGAQ